MYLQYSITTILHWKRIYGKKKYFSLNIISKRNSICFNRGWIELSGYLSRLYFVYSHFFLLRMFVSFSFACFLFLLYISMFLIFASYFLSVKMYTFSLVNRPTWDEEKKIRNAFYYIKFHGRKVGNTQGI